jgi:serine/threonine-protein kinase
VQIGEILAGKYRVDRVLGVGAMGVVVAATHVDLLELRAIKLMLPSMLGDREGVERFLREARAVSKLRSRHVAAVFDVGRLETGAPYIVMEHLEGVDLKSVLEQRGVLTVHEAAAYVMEACEALAEAHAAGIIHRDLKPANLFVVARRDAAPTIKVLDFGIAKMAARSDAEAALEMTGTSEMLGTPVYMAPEQMRASRSADARSDVWSLGVILYRALTGKVPFDGGTLTELCMAVLDDTPARPSTLRPDLPRGLDAVILRCLEKDPARRIGSAAELAMALAPFVTPGVRAPDRSFDAAADRAPVGPPSAALDAGVQVLAPHPAERRDTTTSHASWAPERSGSFTRSRRPWLLGAAVLAVLAVIVGGRRLASQSSERVTAGAIDAAATSRPLPSATAVVLAAPERIAPSAAAPVVVAVASAPASMPVAVRQAARGKPLARGSSSRDAASATAPPPAPVASTGDTFGDGRY